MVRKEDKVTDDVNAIKEEYDSESESQPCGASPFTASPSNHGDLNSVGEGGLKGVIKQNRSNNDLMKLINNNLGAQSVNSTNNFDQQRNKGATVYSQNRGDDQIAFDNSPDMKSFASLSPTDKGKNTMGMNLSGLAAVDGNVS